MLLNLSDLSDEPLQSQISRQIRAKILAGDLRAADSLPSIRAMARDLKVSVITVQRSYEALERDGLIIARRGKGFFVAEIDSALKKKMAEDKLADKISPIIKEALAEGMNPEEMNNIIQTSINKIRNKKL